MHFDEYQSFDATGLALLVKNNDITPEELLNIAIKRLQETNDKTNAVWSTFEEIALKEIKNIPKSAPFYGVPFLLKDLLGDYKGTVLSHGSKAYQNWVSEHDSELVNRYKQLGLLIFGKTATPEMGIMGTTEPHSHGPCRNPWNTEHSTGGSSGGSAASVASGIVPVASAGDGGGSIRIPASCCGIFGLKPTRGRTSNAPAGELWDGATVQHVVSRSVRDSAALLDYTLGGVQGDPYLIGQPNKTFLELQNSPSIKLKIAYSTKHPLGREVSSDCVKAVEKTITILQDLGHTVEEATPKIDNNQLARDYITMVAGQVALNVREAMKRFGNKARNQFELTTQTLELLGSSISAADYVECRSHWNDYARSMAIFHQKYDLYLTPTLARTPVKIGELAPSNSEVMLMKIANSMRLGQVLLKSGVVDELAHKSLEVVPYTQLANLTGAPAMSVPLHWSENGLPVGLHFMAPWGDESTLFQLAFELEKAKPWKDQRAKL